ncbi:hypothetical protein [Aquifex pyrophilus]
MREVESTTRVAPVLIRGLYKVLRFILPDEEMFLFDVALFLFYLLVVMPMVSGSVSAILNAFLPDVSIFSINLKDYISYVAVALTAIVAYRAIFLKNVVPVSRCYKMVEWKRIEKEGELVKIVNTSKGKVRLYSLGNSLAIVPQDYRISLKDWEAIEDFFRGNGLHAKDADAVAELLSSL